MEREFHFADVEDLPDGDAVRIDVRWKIEKGKVKDFAINVTLLENDKASDVFRVDTKHGYLHEQKFWRSPKTIPLDYQNYNIAFIEKKDEVFKRYKRWVELYKEARRRGDI